MDQQILDKAREGDQEPFFIFDPKCFYLGEKFEMVKVVDPKSKAEKDIKVRWKRTGRKLKQYMGLTVALRAVDLSVGRDGQIRVDLEIALAFCSPRDSFGYKEGIANSLERLDSHASFILPIRVKDLANGKLKRKVLARLWKSVFNVDEAEGVERGILARKYLNENKVWELTCKRLGIPTKLVHWFVFERK